MSQGNKPTSGQRTAVSPARTDALGRPEYLKIEGLSRDFDGFMAVDRVTLSIQQREIFALLGASGCGKSTLLRLLAGFEMPSAGRIELDGEDLAGLPPYRRPVNMMFQSYALFPHMTVADNIAFGLKHDGLSREQRKRRVEEMLALVQMESMARRKPHQLSGGQQQRVALARSLAKRPKLLLLDEPMGALDKKLRSEMQLEVVNIIEQLGVTCVMVTHDQEEAMTMANRIAIMDQGRIVQVGTPDEIYEQPATRFTAAFVGSVNLIAGAIEVDKPDHITIQAAGLPEPVRVGHGHTGYEGMEVTFALRPEKLVVTKERPEQRHNCFRGKIEEIAYLGSHSVLHVVLESGLVLLAHVPNSRRWASEDFTWEDRVWVSWDDLAGVVLDS